MPTAQWPLQITVEIRHPPQSWFWVKTSRLPPAGGLHSGPFVLQQSPAGAL
jgi:hypothetical protein